MTEWIPIASAPDDKSVLTYPHHRKAYYDKHFNRWVKRSITHNTIIPLDPQPTHYIELIPDPIVVTYEETLMESDEAMGVMMTTMEKDSEE